MSAGCAAVCDCEDCAKRNVAATESANTPRAGTKDVLVSCMHVTESATILPLPACERRVTDSFRVARGPTLSSDGAHYASDHPIFPARRASFNGPYERSG